jgi:hypothetical protein
MPRKRRLLLKWSKSERDLVVYYPEAPAPNYVPHTDANVVIDAICGPNLPDLRSLRNELERRGYDITTLRFQVDRIKGWRPAGSKGKATE